MQKGLLKGISVLAILALGIVFFAGTAFASSTPHHQVAPAVTITHCGGTCDGKDPYTFYSGVRCSDTAYIANSADIHDSISDLLHIQNWYSNSCQTNWAVAYLQGNTYAVSIDARNIVTGEKQCEPTDCVHNYTGNASPLWTNMLVSPTDRVCIDGDAWDRHNLTGTFWQGSACA